MERNVGTPDKGRHFAAGFVSGIASAVALQPLDLLKTRTQQEHGGGGRLSFGANLRSVLYSAHGRPRPLALWKGTIPSTLRTGFGSALYFSLLNTLRHQWLRVDGVDGVDGVHRPGDQDVQRGYSSNLPVLSTTANLATGASARTLAGLLLMPLTVIKVRFESSLYSYRSLWEATKDIHAAQGFRGFFSGFGATALRDGPNAGLYIVMYEMLKQHLGKASVARLMPQDNSTSSTTHDQATTATGAAAINFTSAVLAGSACSVASNPFDVVKTRIQLDPKRYRNMTYAFTSLVSKEGLGWALDGLFLRMTRKALSSALAWTVYEELVRMASQSKKPVGVI